MKNKVDFTKSISENMKNLGASPESIIYVMGIINKLSKNNLKLKARVKAQAEELSKRCFEGVIRKRKMVAIEERKLKVVTVKSATSKITINPCDGRVELKVSHKSSDNVRDYLIKLVNNVINYDSFLPFTYRGKIDFSKSRKEYYVILQTESKRIKGIKLAIKEAV